jgi:hypothetical protein
VRPEEPEHAETRIAERKTETKRTRTTLPPADVTRREH